MVLELHQVKEDIVNSSLIGFFREYKFSELQPLPLFSPTFFHRVGCWHQFFGVFSKSINVNLTLIKGNAIKKFSGAPNTTKSIRPKVTQ